MNLTPIKTLFHVEKGSLQSSKCTPGSFNFITAAAEWKTHNDYSHTGEALVFAAAASGSLGRTHYVNGDFIASDLCFILTPKDEKQHPVDLKFYHLIFNTLRTEIVRNTKSGTSKEAIGKTVFGNYQIPYFQVSRQVSIREQFMSLQADSLKLENELTHQLSLVQQLRQAFLREAMQGKLVPQDPNDEPASVLLERIKAEKEQLVKEKKIKKQKPLPSISEDEIPFEIPESWVWCRLGEIVNLITSGSRGWAKYYSKEGAKFLRMGNLSKDSYNLRLDNIQLVNPPDNSEGKRTQLKENDILVSITGEVGNLGLIPKDFGRSYINQHTGLIRLNKNILPLFVANCFLSPFLKEQFNKPQRGLKNSFRLTDLEYLTIPLAPISEQKRIIASLREIMSFCDKVESCVKKSKKQNNMLLQRILMECLNK